MTDTIHYGREWDRLLTLKKLGQKRVRIWTQFFSRIILRTNKIKKRQRNKSCKQSSGIWRFIIVRREENAIRIHCLRGGRSCIVAREQTMYTHMSAVLPLKTCCNDLSLYTFLKV